jgi:hypothetical protein
MFSFRPKLINEINVIYQFASSGVKFGLSHIYGLQSRRLDGQRDAFSLPSRRGMCFILVT